MAPALSDSPSSMSKTKRFSKVRMLGSVLIIGFMGFMGFMGPGCGDPPAPPKVIPSPGDVPPVRLPSQARPLMPEAPAVYGLIQNPSKLVHSFAPSPEGIPLLLAPLLAEKSEPLCSLRRSALLQGHPEDGVRSRDPRESPSGVEGSPAVDGADPDLAGRCPLGPRFVRTIAGKNLCLVHDPPVAGLRPSSTSGPSPTTDPASDLAADLASDRAKSVASRLLDLLDAVGRVHLAWSLRDPRHGVGEVTSDRGDELSRCVLDLLQKDLALFVPESRLRATESGVRFVMGPIEDPKESPPPSLGAGSGWRELAPFDRIQSFPAMTWGVEIALRFGTESGLSMKGREVPWWLRSFSLPTWVYFRMTGVEAHLELGFEDRVAAAAFSRDFSVLVQTAHHATQGGPLLSGKRLGTFQMIDRLFGKAENQVLDGEPVVMLEGPLQIQKNEWLESTTRLASWVEGERSQTGADACREARIQLLLAGEMWQLDTDRLPPRDQQRLVDAGLMDSIPSCPDGGVLSLEADFTVHCTRHPNVVAASTD